MSNRNMSLSSVPAVNRLERVLATGELLRKLELKDDLLASGTKPVGPVSEQFISDMLMSADLLSFLKMKNFVLANKNLNQSYKDSLGWEPVKRFLLYLLDNEIECAKFVLNCYMVDFWDHQYATNNMKKMFSYILFSYY